MTAGCWGASGEGTTAGTKEAGGDAQDRHAAGLLEELGKQELEGGRAGERWAGARSHGTKAIFKETDLDSTAKEATGGL